MTVATPLRIAASAVGKELVLRVISKQEVSDGVVLIDLEHPDGRRLPDWAPGAHIDVTTGSGITRQYSLCGDRMDSRIFRIGVLREPESRGGSEYIHSQLSEGDTVTVGGPRNNFVLVPAKKYLFIGGGIGITPIIPMIQQADLLGVEWELLYGGRTRSSMAFLDRLTGSNVRVWPQDEHGHLPIQEVLANLEEGTKVYVCGPGPLLDAVEELSAHLPIGVVRMERFVAKELGAPQRTDAFEVELAQSARTITVEPGQTVLDAVSGAGLRVLSSCSQGLCGTCEVGVISGRPEHRDSILDDDEREANDCMYVCVSRSLDDRLVLDL